MDENTTSIEEVVKKDINKVTRKSKRQANNCRPLKDLHKNFSSRRKHVANLYPKYLFLNKMIPRSGGGGIDVSLEVQLPGR